MEQRSALIISLLLFSSLERSHFFSSQKSGNINLFTIRHDEGHIRHVFKAANPPSTAPLTSSSDVRGHKPGSVISSLDLNSDQNIAFSGGWDGIVLVSLARRFLAEIETFDSKGFCYVLLDICSQIGRMDSRDGISIPDK